MSQPAIRVVDLSKEYHIGLERKSGRTLRETIVDAATGPIRRAAKLLRGQATGAAELDASHWALKNVSFEIPHGDVVGVIGRNGAGKSTLMKVLSKITEPTQGFADIRGRVGSLLEVGTGFHEELSGRENIYLNGAILGMRKTEIDRKFDEIVCFCGDWQVSGHSGEALFQRYVRASRILGGGPPGAGDSSRGRGTVGGGLWLFKRSVLAK